MTLQRKWKSCPNIHFTYNEILCSSYGEFLRRNPNASKSERCLAIARYWKYIS